MSLGIGFSVWKWKRPGPFHDEGLAGMLCFDHLLSKWKSVEQLLLLSATSDGLERGRGEFK